MPIPDTIPVRYSEDEAEYVSLRPVVRQTFRPAELLELILSVTGHDTARVRQILHAGNIVFHGYRYWWQRIDIPEEELADLLRPFPQADPSRVFRAEDCQTIVLDTSPGACELTKQMLSRPRWFRRRSLWDLLMEKATQGKPAYQTYSYAIRSDLFALEISEKWGKLLGEEGLWLAPRALRREAELIARARRMVFACPRKA